VIRAAVIAAVVLVLHVVPAAAQAPAATQRAPSADAAEDAGRVHFAEGRRLASDSRFAEALEAFARGHAASGRPLFLFNMAECAREIGEAERAVALYERYLAADPEGPMAARATARLAALGERAPRAEARAASEAAVSAVPAVELPPDPEIAPGAISSSSSRSISSAAASSIDRRPEVWEDWPFWMIVGAVVVAGAAVGIAVGVGVDGGPRCEAGCVDLRLVGAPR
jgi:tetratricopeptide (TPR) repeat protein